MATFLFCWELGGGLGHSVPLAQIAGPLLAGGHAVHVALRDLSTAGAAFGVLQDHPRLRLWQAPVWSAVLRGLPESATYAELLFRAGFLDAGRLLGPVRGWRSLIEHVAPDLLLVDHAPTALLAARGLGLPTASIGTGFFQPPAIAPIPSFREWDQVDPRRVDEAEARAVETINAVCLHLGSPPVSALHQLVAVDEQFLLTWPEVDHYRPVRAEDDRARFLGPLAATTQGAAAEWPPGEGRQVFAYLKGDYAPLEAVLLALKTAPFRSLAYVPGLPPALAARYASPRIRFSPVPVNMTAACAGADAVLCNAGSGTVCTVLRSGIPVVMLPMHAEQLLFARRVEQLEAGLTLAENDIRANLAKSLRRMIEQPTYREAAQRIAARHAADAGRDVAAEVAARCVALATARTPATGAVLPR